MSNYGKREGATSVTKTTLPIRMRAWLSREPSIGYVAEARVLMREALAELERLQKLASAVWPEEGECGE